MSLENDQEAMKVLEAVKLALLELHIYGTTHTVEDALGASVQELVGAGAFSSQSAAFIATHQVRFHGFKPRPFRRDIPVLEVLLADRTAPLRFTGFRDGHVEVAAERSQ
jgi:hypothetical protein